MMTVRHLNVMLFLIMRVLICYRLNAFIQDRDLFVGNKLDGLVD